MGYQKAVAGSGIGARSAGGKVDARREIQPFSMEAGAIRHIKNDPAVFVHYVCETLAVG